MKQSIERFLQFNGKTLLFLAKDGTNWIALKPICEALGIEYTRTFKNVSADPIIGPALAKTANAGTRRSDQKHDLYPGKLDLWLDLFHQQFECGASELQTRLLPAAV